VLQEKARSTADWSAQHARVIFGMQFERRWHDNKKTYMKTETCKLYSGVFWILLPIIIKIDRYNFELYRFKVGPFLTRHSVVSTINGACKDYGMAMNVKKTKTMVINKCRDTQCSGLW